MATGNYWHCNKDGIGNIDVYAVEPTGDAVQLNGDITSDGRTTLKELGCFNTSNILFHLCSEGRCGEKWIENDDLWTPSDSSSDSGADSSADSGADAGADASADAGATTVDSGADTSAEAGVSSDAGSTASAGSGAGGAAAGP